MVVSCQMVCFNTLMPLNTSSDAMLLALNYCIAGKFGGDLNLAVWRSGLKPPN